MLDAMKINLELKKNTDIQHIKPKINVIYKHNS